jgi:hypothetical protein
VIEVVMEPARSCFRGKRCGQGTIHPFESRQRRGSIDAVFHIHVEDGDYVTYDSPGTAGKLLLPGFDLRRVGTGVVLPRLDEWDLLVVDGKVTPVLFEVVCVLL